MNQVISTSLSIPSASNEMEVLIEQEDFPDLVGQLTKGRTINGVASFEYPQLVVPILNNCGGDNSKYGTIFYVYPYDISLNYEFDTSYGLVSDRVIEETIYSELATVELSETYELRYPTQGIISSEWIGIIYDEDGGEITGAEFEIIDNVIVFDKPVVGNLFIRYNVTRHVYAVAISAIIGYTNDRYFAYAYAVWDGGIETKKIDFPDNFDVSDGGCGNGSLEVIPPPQDQPIATGEDRVDEVNYCSQEPI